MSGTTARASEFSTSGTCRAGHATGKRAAFSRSGAHGALHRARVGPSLARSAAMTYVRMVHVAAGTSCCAASRSGSTGVRGDRGASWRAVLPGIWRTDGRRKMIEELQFYALPAARSATEQSRIPTLTLDRVSGLRRRDRYGWSRCSPWAEATASSRPCSASALCARGAAERQALVHTSS